MIVKLLQNNTRRLHLLHHSTTWLHTLVYLQKDGVTGGACAPLIADRVLQSNLDYPDFLIIWTFSLVPIWS